MRAGMIALAALALAALAPTMGQGAEPGWTADPQTGCRVWNGAPQPNETISWSGRCRNGLAQGPGVVQWLEDGKPSGRDEGEYRDDKRNGHRDGHSVQTFANGDRYEGLWNHGCFKDGNRFAAVDIDSATCG